MKLFLRLAGRLAGIVALTMALTVIARVQSDDITPDPFQKNKEPVHLTPQADRGRLYTARAAEVQLASPPPAQPAINAKETLNKFCAIHRDSRYIAEKEQSTANHEAKDIGDGKRL